VKKQVSEIWQDKSMFIKALAHPICQKVLAHEELVTQALQDASLSQSLNAGEVALKWQRLNESQSFKCSICRGILAAPCILPCSHTFCGECLLEKRRVQTLDSDTELLCFCPECRAVAPDNQMTFERKLDSFILEEIMSIQDAGIASEYIQKEISDWKQKRKHYLSKRGAFKQDIKQDSDDTDASQNIDDDLFTTISISICIVLAISVCVAISLSRTNKK